MEPKFYICRRCGNLAGLISDSGIPMTCCDQKMEMLTPNTVEASGEKHIPDATLVYGNLQVNIGTIDHPMSAEHYIAWVYVETETGGYCKKLTPGNAPTISFALGTDKAVAVYAYCNLHGLWMTKL